MRERADGWFGGPGPEQRLQEPSVHEPETGEYDPEERAYAADKRRDAGIDWNLTERDDS
jgi:hypothetical protein